MLLRVCRSIFVYDFRSQSLSTQREPGPALELPLRRGDDALPEKLDRPTTLAAAQTDGETGRHARQASGWHPELLPDQGSAGCRGGCQRQHQSPAATRKRISKSELPVTQGPAPCCHQNPTYRLSKGRVKRTLLQIRVKSP